MTQGIPLTLVGGIGILKVSALFVHFLNMPGHLDFMQCAHRCCALWELLGVEIFCVFPRFHTNDSILLPLVGSQMKSQACPLQLRWMTKFVSSHTLNIATKVVPFCSVFKISSRRPLIHYASMTSAIEE